MPRWQMAGIERLMRRNEVGSRNGGLPPGGGVALPFILVQVGAMGRWGVKGWVSAMVGGGERGWIRVWVRAS